IFSADEFNEGKESIREVLDREGIKAGFFLTGKFYRNPVNRSFIEHLRDQGHYLSGHSDQHLLYCDWDKRDSLLVSEREFTDDLDRNFQAMERYGVDRNQVHYFLPPFEWYNATISQWFTKSDLQ